MDEGEVASGQLHRLWKERSVCSGCYGDGCYGGVAMVVVAMGVIVVLMVGMALVSFSKGVCVNFQ